MEEEAVKELLLRVERLSSYLLASQMMACACCMWSSMSCSTTSCSKKYPCVRMGLSQHGKPESQFDQKSGEKGADTDYTLHELRHHVFHHAVATHGGSKLT